jgi:hypothetical protein
MSFEILEAPQTTTFAPLNTTIDADRDYYSLTGLDACACGGGAARHEAQMGPPPAPAAGVSGYYDGGMLPEGMLEAAPAGASKMVWLLGGAVAVWAAWAWFTPHQPMAEW